MENLTLFPLYQPTCFFIPLVAPCKPLLALEDTEEVSFEDAINSGRIYFKDFPKLVEKITEKKNEQLLMLKENFRQLGEYDNEDICHLHYQKAKTKEEKRYYIRD